MPANDDDDLYLATLTLDQERVRKAIAPLTPEQKQLKMMLDIATHGAHIASLHNAKRKLEKDVAAANKRITDNTKELVENARDMRSSITFLYWTVGIGFALIVVAVFRSL